MLYSNFVYVYPLLVERDVAEVTRIDRRIRRPTSADRET